MSGTRYLDRARQLAADYARLRADDMYVVWFCKTLQNWKALVSTDTLRGVYIEVTHNGDRRETYVDAYEKAGSIAVPDEPAERAAA